MSILNKKIFLITVLIFAAASLVFYFNFYDRRQPNILIFSVYNLNLLEESTIKSLADKIESVTQYKTKVITQKPEGESGIKYWQKHAKQDFEKNNYIPIGFGSHYPTENNSRTTDELNFFIKIHNNVKILNFSTKIISKIINKQYEQPFFLLLEYYFLAPPLYDVDLSEEFQIELKGESLKLLDKYLYSSGDSLNKTFFISTLFDDVRLEIPTSLQTVKNFNIFEKSFKKTPNWQSLYSEWKQSKNTQQDLLLRDQLISARYKTLEKEILVIIKKSANRLTQRETYIVIQGQQIFKKNFADDKASRTQRSIIIAPPGSRVLSIFNNSEQIETQLLRAMKFN